jgi:hypothetical protein
MTIALLISLLLIPTMSHARVESTIVLEIERAPGADAMVKVGGGRVLWVEEATGLVDALEEARRQHRTVELDFDEGEHRLIGARLGAALPPTETAPHSKGRKDSAEPLFYPTVYSSFEQAQAAFNTMDGRTKDDSQCYNRAHGWAYDLSRTQNVNSMKIFLFFTNRYIRTYRHKWWFHVSPLVYVREPNGATAEMVMDRSFSQMPLYPQVWTNTFLKNQPVCRSINNYGDYYKDDPYEWCYLIRATMFYRGTTGLKKRDQYWNPKYKTRWNLSEIRQSRRQAFIHASEYEN